MEVKNNVIPVVIFHEGCPGYLPYSVASAQRNNERVIMLGNDANKHLGNEWYDCNSFDLSRFEEFKKYFVNYSTYTDFFAIIVFRRYFIIYELMKKLKLDRVMMVESDVFTCANYSGIPALDDAYAMVSTVEKQEKNYNWTSAGHCSYWTAEALDDFLTFCMKTYSENAKLLLEKWEYHQSRKEAGGVCDMTLVYLWAKDKENVLNSTKVIDGGTMDQNICDKVNYTEDEYQFSNFGKVKKYKLIKNDEGRKVPYLVKKDGSLMLVYSIHCSGRGKSAIKYMDKSFFMVCAVEAAALLKIKLGAIKNKLKR